MNLTENLSLNPSPSGAIVSLALPVLLKQIFTGTSCALLGVAKYFSDRLSSGVSASCRLENKHRNHLEGSSLFSHSALNSLTGNSSQHK